MNHVVQIFRCCIAGLMLAAFAMPAGAANPVKIYSLNVSAFGVSPVELTIKNETPNGNSTINSFILSPPTGVTITSLATPPNSSAPADVQLVGGKVYVKGFDGLKAGNQTPKSITIKVNATYPSSPGCGTNYTWTAVVYTGNSFGMETFALNAGNPPTSPTQATGGCTYSYTVTPSPLSAGTSTSLTATVTNGSTDATINSFTLTRPSGGAFKITGVTPSANVSFTNTSVTVSPAALGPGASVVLTLAVDTDCATSSGSWTASVASSSGTFTRTGSAPITAVSGNCTMAFTTQPTSAAAGEAITPPMVIVAKGATGLPVPWFTGPVTLYTGVCGTGPVGTVNASSGTATFSSVVLATAGTYTLTACSNLGTASTTFAVASNSFNIFAGRIVCGEPFAGLDISNPPNATKGDPGAYPPIPPTVGFARGMRDGNKDGSDCPDPGARIPYTFTNTIPTNNTVILDWDAIAAPYAVFRYQATLQDEPVGVDGLPSYTTLLLFPNTPGGTKIAHVGVACLSGDSPGKFGTLSAPVSISGSTVTISGIATLPKTPIAIWVTSFSTSTGERMKATNPVAVGSDYKFDVIRGDGGTGAKGHNSGAQVYITPLPVDPNAFLPDGTTANFFHNKQVPMCIISERWEAIGGAFLRPTIDAFDSGDGGISRAP